MLRFVVIFALLFHPAILVGSKACGAKDATASRSESHTCCCGGACPVMAKMPTMCGCCGTNQTEPQPKAPPAPQVRVDFGPAPALITFQLPANATDRINLVPVALALPTAVSLNALHCTWLT